MIAASIVVTVSVALAIQLPPPLKSLGAHELVLVGAGDIARCDSRGDEATAKLVQSVLDVSDAAWAFTAGDNVYPNGTLEEFRRCYEPSWGPFKARTLPTVGNHDARTKRSAGLRATFAGRFSQDGPLWYAVDVKGDGSDGHAAAWRVVVLDSNCDQVDCTEDGAQYAWLKDELRRQKAKGTSCTVAVFHHPRFSSGPHGDATAMAPMWRLLDERGVDLVVAGHDHIYERFAALDDGGAQKPGGLPSIVSGLGGASRYPIVWARAGSIFRKDDRDGVLVLRLRSDGYTGALWTTDGEVHDVHEGRCR